MAAVLHVVTGRLTGCCYTVTAELTMRSRGASFAFSRPIFPDSVPAYVFRTDILSGQFRQMYSVPAIFGLG